MPGWTVEKKLRAGLPPVPQKAKRRTEVRL
jgi:hypothetical protein